MNILRNRPRKDPLRILYEDPPVSLADTYHESSKLNEFNGRSFRRRMNSVVGSPFFLKIIAQSYKTYPTATLVPLSGSQEAKDETPLAGGLRRVIQGRRSVREFSGAPLTISQVSAILRNSYGITGRFKMSYGIDQKVRAVPSGGALFPLEIYLGAFRVEGLDPAIYHYNVQEHGLEKVREGLFDTQLGEAFFYEEMFKKVSIAIVITGIRKRSSLKYGERSYRFMTLEAGHVGQNICLSASALELGCVMLGGFFDDDVNSLVEVDGVNEMTLYGAAIGKI
jgi:SagB-type dehydrogenase family enzyme